MSTDSHQFNICTNDVLENHYLSSMAGVVIVQPVLALIVSEDNQGQDNQGRTTNFVHAKAWYCCDAFVCRPVRLVIFAAGLRVNNEAAFRSQSCSHSLIPPAIGCVL